MTFDLILLNPETVIVRIGQALDYRNTEAFKNLGKKQLQLGIRNFILDFSQTGVLDSTGLGAIIYLHHQVKPISGNIVFAEPSRPVQAVVQLTKAHHVFVQFANLENAKRFFGDHSINPLNDKNQGLGLSSGSTRSSS